MKNLFVFSLFLFSMLAFAQNIGNAQIKIYGKFTDENVLKHDLWLDKDGIFIMIFDQTTVGVKHAVDKADKILKENKLSIDKPDEDESLLGRMVKDFRDYENLDFSLQLSKSEIKKVWHIDGGIFALSLNKGMYMVFYAKKPTDN